MERIGELLHERRLGGRGRHSRIGDESILGEQCLPDCVDAVSHGSLWLMSGQCDLVRPF